MKRIIAPVMIVFLVLPGGHGGPAGEEHTAPWGEHRVKEGGNAQIAENETPCQDQNQIWLAIHALLAAENRTGGIGPNIPVIARKTPEAGEQIRARHGFMRFLIGGDEDACPPDRRRDAAEPGADHGTWAVDRELQPLTTKPGRCSGNRSG